MLRDVYEFIGQKLHNAEFGNDFLDIILKEQAKKKEVDKLHFMKIKKNYIRLLTEQKKSEWEKYLQILYLT